MDNGWIKFHRKTWDNAITDKPNYLAVWLYLLSHANHEDKQIIWNNKKTTINRGSFIGSLRNISRKFNIGISTVKYIIDYLVSEQMIEHKPNKKFSLFTVLNYNLYQSIEHQTEHKVNTNETQIKTTKNDKNDKNIIINNNTKQSFGNENINNVLQMIKDKFNLQMLDGTEKSNRYFANLLIRKVKGDMGVIENVLDMAAADNFWHNKITGVKPVYYNIVKIASLAKEKRGGICNIS